MNSYLVIGDVMLDYYRKGFADRISPEAPVPIALNPTNEFSAGGAANVAINLTHDYKDAVTLVGLVGDDKYARKLEHCVHEYGVNVDLLRQLQRTIVKERIVCNDQQVIRIDTEIPNSQYNILQHLKDKHNTRHDCVILSDYAKGCLLNVEGIINHFREIQTPIYVDPKGKDFYRYKNAFALTPNEKEFKENYLYNTSLSLSENMIAIRSMLNLNYLFVTRGSKGVYFVDTLDNVSEVSAQKVDVLDVTGAGDVFISSLVRNMQVGRDALTSVQIAVDIATASVTLRGTTKQTTVESTSDGMDKKITVFTNGCFDLIHAGHIDYLTKAKALGNYLIVGMNSDQSVSKLKGPHRPIVTQSERKIILDAINVVDEVVIFNSTTPQDLIQKLKPDVLVKGGDYELDEIVGSEFVQSYGGKVVRIPIVHHQSTTNISTTISKGAKVD
jgi:D-beta-D-heptose 7-phosphate kinase / D-beta-D-heptose 1-phosphate adenosyltransferase